MNTERLPKRVFSGHWQTGHVQGIAVDTQKKYMYFSFTTCLVKTDLQGNVIGSVTGLVGHLGCIDFNDEDGRVYGSLEFKNDSIGRGILNMLGSDASFPDGFYIAVFDGDKIDRVGMDASADGIMTAVWLKTVTDDFNGTACSGGREFRHALGCSGIDGTTFGRLPGADDDKQYLFVAYGVYGDAERADNDHQVILCYDTADWKRYEKPLIQTDMHTSGPDAPYKKLYVRTGNTNYGVQNLEYDAHTGHFLMAVYRGNKPGWPNYPLFIVDGGCAPVWRTLEGVEPETAGEQMELLKAGEHDEATGVYGFEFKHGACGLYSFGDGLFYVAHEGHDEDGWFADVRLYRWDGVSPLVEVE